MFLFLVIFIPGCIKKADQILKRDTFLPGPGAYTVKIDDSQNPYPTIRSEVQHFMTSLLARTPDCTESTGEKSDYVIQIQYQNTPGCDSSQGAPSLKGAAKHTLEIQIVKASEGIVVYEGSIEQKCTTQEFQSSLQSMLKDLIQKKPENTGHSMSLRSSVDYGDR